MLREGGEGMCPTGTPVRSMVVERLKHSSFSPPPTRPVLACTGQGLEGELLADKGGLGSPGLEQEMGGETAQGGQLYMKEIYLFTQQTLPAPLG